MSSGERLEYNSGGYSSGEDISTEPAVLNNINGHNASGTDAFLLVFNSAFANVNPGEIPVQSIPVAAGAEFSWSPTPPGRLFNLALSWAVSSTGDLYTAAALDFWVYAEGREA